MRLLYTSFISLYQIGIYLVAIWDEKARLWVEGRKDWIAKIPKIPTDKDLFWFHCASLGEFEQGRPLMEKLKAANSNSLIYVTFFSPSGYKIRKNDPIADFVGYLPMDFTGNAKKMVDRLNPKCVFFIKYEFWYNYLNYFKSHRIPTFLISGIFRENQYFFKWYGSWFKKQLSCFTHFFLQNESSRQLLQSNGIQNTSVSGDTRFDRVLKILSSPQKFNQFEVDDSNQRDTFIIGSNWPEDDEILLPLVNKLGTKYRFIIAPHDIKGEQLTNIESNLKLNTYRLSNVESQTRADWNVIIIDSIGKLSSVYQYGKIAYVGGGFGSNVHNILEAATYGIPTIFGPNYHKFQECKDLIALKGAFTVSNAETLENAINYLSIPENYRKASDASRSYVKENSGGTERIWNYLKSEYL